MSCSDTPNDPATLETTSQDQWEPALPLNQITTLIDTLFYSTPLKSTQLFTTLNCNQTNSFDFTFNAQLITLVIPTLHSNVTQFYSTLLISTQTKDSKENTRKIWVNLKKKTTLLSEQNKKLSSN